MIRGSTHAGSRSSPRRIGCEATRSDRGSLPGRPANNKMQQTRSAHPRWRPSLLILVFYAPRQGRAGPQVRRLDSHSRPTSTYGVANGHSFRSSVPGLALTPCPTRRVTALAARAKRRATPPLSPDRHARPAARLAIEHQARCAGTVERHRDRLTPSVTLSPRRAASHGHDLG